MTRRKSYKTAAARRRADPFTWEIDDRDPITLRPVVPFEDIANAIGEMQEEQARNVDGELPTQKAARLSEALRAFLGGFVDEADAEKWEAVKGDLDVEVLRDMVNDVITEYTGVDPTQRESSSDGASPTGPPSTPTVLPTPEASTLSDSPPTAP